MSPLNGLLSLSLETGTPSPPDSWGASPPMESTSPGLQEASPGLQWATSWVLVESVSAIPGPLLGELLQKQGSLMFF